MDILQKSNTLLSDIEPKNVIILTYLNKNMNGPALSMEMLKRKDNNSVVTSSTISQSILNKRHNMLSYHRVREAIAAKILEFHWCSSDQNKSDILSKHWEPTKVKNMIRELFDYQGDIILLNQIDGLVHQEGE